MNLNINYFPRILWSLRYSRKCHIFGTPLWSKSQEVVSLDSVCESTSMREPGQVRARSTTPLLRCCLLFFDHASPTPFWLLTRFPLASTPDFWTVFSICSYLAEWGLSVKTLAHIHPFNSFTADCFSDPLGPSHSQHGSSPSRCSLRGAPLPLEKGKSRSYDFHFLRMQMFTQWTFSPSCPNSLHHMELVPYTDLSLTEYDLSPLTWKRATIQGHFPLFTLFPPLPLYFLFYQKSLLAPPMRSYSVLGVGIIKTQSLFYKLIC